MGAPKPVIATNAETGEQLRYPSGIAAGEALGINSNQISIAKLTGRKCHGYYFDEDEDVSEPAIGE